MSDSERAAHFTSSDSTRGYVLVTNITDLEEIRNCRYDYNSAIEALIQLFAHPLNRANKMSRDGGNKTKLVSPHFRWDLRVPGDSYRHTNAIIYDDPVMATDFLLERSDAAVFGPTGQTNQYWSERFPNPQDTLLTQTFIVNADRQSDELLRVALTILSYYVPDLVYICTTVPESAWVTPAVIARQVTGNSGLVGLFKPHPTWLRPKQLPRPPRPPAQQVPIGVSRSGKVVSMDPATGMADITEPSGPWTGVNGPYMGVDPATAGKDITAAIQTFSDNFSAEVKQALKGIEPALRSMSDALANAQAFNERDKQRDPSDD